MASMEGMAVSVMGDARSTILQVSAEDRTVVQ
jgi:hypothetical protein